jgi:hypothetical protein
MGITGPRLIVTRIGFPKENRRLAGAALAIVLSVAPLTAHAQTPSLGEVARKEAERRKALPPAGKVYTNKDLPASAQKPATPSSGAGTETTIPLDPVAAATADKPADKPGDKPAEDDGKGKGEVKNEAWWRAKMAAAREAVRRNELFAESLQTRINSLSRDFTSRDNPAQRAQIGRDRTDALSELAKLKQEVERGKQEIADLEEEARKASVPPGWLR